MGHPAGARLVSSHFDSVCHSSRFVQSPFFRAAGETRGYPGMGTHKPPSLSAQLSLTQTLPTDIVRERGSLKGLRRDFPSNGSQVPAAQNDVGLSGKLWVNRDTPTPFRPQGAPSAT